MKINKNILPFVLAPLIVACNQDTSQSAGDHFAQAFTYISSAKLASGSQREELLKNAEIELGEALKANPKHFDSWLNMGVLHATKGRVNKALEAYNKAKEIKPFDASLNYNLACLYSVTDKLDLAIEALDIALTNGFDDLERLRNDEDLNSLRATKEFTDVLESHKFFIK